MSLSCEYATSRDARRLVPKTWLPEQTSVEVPAQTIRERPVRTIRTSKRFSHPDETVFVEQPPKLSLPNGDVRLSKSVVSSKVSSSTPATPTTPVTPKEVWVDDNGTIYDPDDYGELSSSHSNVKPQDDGPFQGEIKR